MAKFMYVLLAILGISFLIFIHEMGHYLMARRAGMRVETFSIGFGKPIYSWMHNGVKWQIGWLLFGGYVKIAGVDLEKDQNPYEVPDGFFGKKPIERIKVALMGPIANIVFALLAFTFLWTFGGREKNFSETTSIIGWVDPQSELYRLGVRPGDEIASYDNQTFQTSVDHLAAPMRANEKISVEGSKINYATGERVPFDHTVNVYQHPTAFEKGRMTAGIISPASYIIYNRLPGNQENVLPEGSPLVDSGIEYGDRIVWVDGEQIFSVQQLNYLLGGNRILLTVERNGKLFLARVPRVFVRELRPDAEFKEELTDWQFEANLNNIKMPNLHAIPYNITNDIVVENELQFIDREDEQTAFPNDPYSSLEMPLQPGDRIVAIQGEPVSKAYEFLSLLQNYRVNVIVQRGLLYLIPEASDRADNSFEKEVNAQDIHAIASSIGSNHPIRNSGDLYLLNPITPKIRSQLHLTAEKQAALATEIQEQRKAIASIDDPELRNHAIKLLEQQEKRLLLGLPMIQDRKVTYNPQPLALFNSVFKEIERTLGALVSGNLNPKWLVGPIGIVHVVHDTTMTGLKEGLYWLGVISLNLGLLNLLPIPVLDGGTIFMSLIELITGRKIHPKTLEKIVIPFAVLLIGFFIFLTYNDLLRIFRIF